jgi:hypothetical protein
LFRGRQFAFEIWQQLIAKLSVADFQRTNLAQLAREIRAQFFLYAKIIQHGAIAFRKIPVRERAVWCRVSPHPRDNRMSEQ